MLSVEEKHLTPEPLKELTLLYEPITLTPKEGALFWAQNFGALGPGLSGLALRPGLDVRSSSASSSVISINHT